MVTKQVPVGSEKRHLRNGGSKTKKSIEFLKPIGTNKPEKEDLFALSESAQTSDQLMPTAFKRLADLSRDVVNYLLEAVFDKCESCWEKLRVRDLINCLQSIWNIQEVERYEPRQFDNLPSRGVVFRLHGTSQKFFVTPEEIQSKLAVMLS